MAINAWNRACHGEVYRGYIQGPYANMYAVVEGTMDSIVSICIVLGFSRRCYIRWL